jgi:hypothetical protein
VQYDEDDDERNFFAFCWGWVDMIDGISALLLASLAFRERCWQ